MQIIEGIYSRLNGGGYARVLIEIDLPPPSAGISIEVDLDRDDEWNQQLFRGEWGDWLDGAAEGVRFALATARVASAAVRVRRVVGLVVDTNPTTVAAAAADAVWRAIGFEPAEDLKGRRHRAVVDSWEGASPRPVMFE